MTSLTMRGAWTSATIHHAAVVRQLVMWVDLINAAAAVLRPLVVSLGVITAGAAWPAPAHADTNAPSLAADPPSVPVLVTATWDFAQNPAQSTEQRHAQRPPGARA
jgi:hypothetical protein